jgi:hypothetical protein
MVYATADANPFFSLPVSIIRQRAQLPAPAPGLPGPFSLGSDGVLAEAFRTAGFHDIVVERIAAPLRLQSAAECVQFEQDAFGALHQMMASLSGMQQAKTWDDIAQALQQFDGPDGFVGPCQMLLGIGVK